MPNYWYYYSSGWIEDMSSPLSGLQAGTLLSWDQRIATQTFFPPAGQKHLIGFISQSQERDMYYTVVQQTHLCKDD